MLQRGVRLQSVVFKSTRPDSQLCLLSPFVFYHSVSFTMKMHHWYLFLGICELKILCSC